MKAIINRFATPFITGLFVISAVSGVALFFHWAPGAFHGMHEWLSLLLLLPFVLHVWKNWVPLVGYVKRRMLLVPLAICLLVAAPFAAAGLMQGGGGGNPAFRAIPLMTQARLSDLAPVLKTTPDALLAQLKAKGYQAGSADQTIDAVAAASGAQASQILISVMPAR